jgi:putative addiction module component (TIGR02574 family)
MSQSFPDDINRLTVAERLELISRLWDSIQDNGTEPEMPEWHRLELERRLALADAAPEPAIPWEQVEARLRERK